MIQKTRPDLFAVFVDSVLETPDGTPERDLWTVRPTRKSAEDERDHNPVIRDMNPSVERYVSATDIRSLFRDMTERAARPDFTRCTWTWAAGLVSRLLYEPKS